MISSEESGELFDGLCAGDPQAARELWDGYYERLVRLARRALGSFPRRVFDEEDVAFIVSRLTAAPPADELARMEAAQLDRLDEVTRTAIHRLPVEWQVVAAAVVPAGEAERIAGRLGVSFAGACRLRL